jgi:twitching motility protein PilT
MRKHEVDLLLATMVDSHPGVSDLNLTVDYPLQVEAHGELLPVSVDPALNKLTPFQTEVFALNLINNDHRLTKTLIHEGSCDLSYVMPRQTRLRVNVFQQQGHFSIAMRKLESKIPTIDELKLPSVFKNIAHEKTGLVLVTGPTGVGKTTSLAALLNEINLTKAVHVITLEDPVEFVHHKVKATFNQRQLGTDFDTFSNGLRAALRAAPKVILVGEMRDRETLELALRASETGHLVLSTLHTIDAARTINRIIGMFPSEEERHIRIRLADAVKWIVGQRLLPKIGGGRVAVHDVLMTNIRLREIILLGESEGKTVYDVQEQGAPFGMQTFDQALVHAYSEGVITEEDAIIYSTQKSVVHRGIDQIKHARGESTTDITGLVVDKTYSKAARRR